MAELEGEPSALDTLAVTLPKVRAPGRRGRAAHPSMQRSQFGKQQDSNKASAPAFGFGSAYRFHPKLATTKQFISKEHSAQELAADTPGPGTYVAASALGPQEKSTNRSAAKFGFGTAARFAEEKRMEKQIARLPAPGTYEAVSALGAQKVSTKETTPILGFGTAVRDAKVSMGKGFDEDLFGLESPGPAVYNPQEGFGEQPANGKATAAAFGFGTNPRAIDPQIPSVEERRSALVPGPGKYVAQAANGVQVSSTNRSLPMYGFGTCDRNRAAKSSLGPLQAPSQLAGITGPGPAALGFGPSAVSAQPASTKKSAPGWSLNKELRFRTNQPSSELSPGPGSYCT